MEDTDEDFFDKLVDDVDDHFNITSSSSSSITATEIKNPNHSNKPKANSNISYGRNTVKFDNVNQEPNNVVQDHGTEGGSGVKELQWNVFASDKLVDSSNVFGSCSDFFTEFDSNLVDPNIKGHNFVSSEAKSVGNSSRVGSVVEYSHQVQENQSCTTSGRQSTDGQDFNNCHYWESLYPGWKYDQSTGQWYQVDQVYDATINGQMTDDPSARSWSSNLHTSHTNKSFPNWNQTSQGNNNGYPPHFYFDPQYPGWYYDMNAQEWRSLDAYNCQIIDQNHFSASNSYSGNEQLDKRSGLDHNWNGSFDKQQGLQPDTVNNVNQQQSYGASFFVDKNTNQQQSYDYGGMVSSVNKPSQVRNEFPARAQYLGSSGNFSQPFSQSLMEQSEMMNATKAYGTRNQLSYSQQSACYKKSYGSTTGRSSAGQPPHALVTFGFGGKLLVLKDTSGLLNSSYGGQESKTGSISVLNLAESVTGVGDMSSGGTGVCSYFHALCRQSFPGPLVGGNVGSKELNRWIDERITCSTDTDYKKDQVLKLLLSLLKIASQHYGKLRSPFGTDTTSKENDVPEVAVVRLFASAKKNNEKYVDYGAFSNCLKQLPSEGQTRAIAAEVQTLLVSGGKMEALHHAQEGQLWGIALVLAAQLGDQFYADTVRNMALRQLVVGSPLRTLCLLIAGQPADVFSADPTANDAVSMRPQAQLGTNAMLDNWEENLAMITANRTKDDELVLIHLGDCLWKETSNIIAAHICYLVAEANFEPYSDTARLCLIGADHWKHPRTYASPEAIQRTEMYEYSKLLGNSQFTLLPFQPYKLIYANMLAEVGRISDSLKYCQVILKSLKTCRAPEVETWRLMVSSLEDRIKTHQEGGFSTGKFVGKLLNLIDSTASRVVGGLPPPVPSTSGSGAQTEHHHQPTGPRVLSSQSKMAMSSLVPSASMEPITQNSAERNNRRIMHNRSVSEPDFANSQSKSSASSGFGHFGSQLFETLALVLSRPDKQAKMGEPNKFYYDKKLGRWVEEGVEPPAEEATLAPPPKGAAKSEGTVGYGTSEFSSTKSSGIPPLPATSSQFSARGRTGVRQRYVDTFNQGGGGNPTKFQSPSAASIKPVAKSNPQIFIPKAVPSVDQPVPSVRDNAQQQPATVDENSSPTSLHNQFQSPSYQSSMQRFASMNDISRGGIIPTFPSTSGSPHSRRTVSWGGSTDERFAANSREMRPNGAVLGMASRSFVPNGDGFNDNLDDVEL